MSDQEAHQLIAKPISDWLNQLQAAVRTVTAKNGGRYPATLLQAYQIDPVAYGEMVEATIALDPYAGKHIPDGLIALAMPFLPSAGGPGV